MNCYAGEHGIMICTVHGVGDENGSFWQGQQLCLSEDERV